MTKFFADVVAVMVGVTFCFLTYAFAAADGNTKVYCDAVTDNPVAMTTCIINHTLK